MKILVCVKQVPASNETRLDPVTNTIIRDGIESILNPFDAYAVEEAVRLKTKYGGRVDALSMGIPAVADMLRRVIAVGADGACLLSDRAFAGADTLATARTLACAVEKMGLPDVILCGRMATDGDTAQVGPMLAEDLGIPHVSDVARIESIQDNLATVCRLTDDGYQRLQVHLPALFTVLKEINIPRLPSIAGIFRGEDTPVTVWNCADLGMEPEKAGLKGSATKVVKSQRPDMRKTCAMLQGDMAQQVHTLRAHLSAARLAGQEVTDHE